MVAKTAYFTMWQMLKSFHYRKKSYLIPLFKTFIRRRLKIAASTWSPWNEGNIRTLERVQERFVKQRGKVERDAGLFTLRERRKQGDLIEPSKTLGGFNKVDKHKWFDIVEENARATRNTSSVSEWGEENVGQTY